MMNLENIIYSPEEIEDLCSSSTVYRRGKSYWKNGNVTELEYDPTLFRYQATVRGSRRYLVTVEIGSHGNSYADCDCPAYDQYAGYCKHIAAVLLQINELQAAQTSSLNLGKMQQMQQKKQASSRNDYLFTNRMIQILDKYDLQDPSIPYAKKHFLNIQVIVHMQNSFASGAFLTLELKVGHQRLYIVRDLKKFLTSVNQRQPYFFTNKFTYDPLEHQFTEQDQELINILIEMMKFERFYNEYSSYFYRSSGNGERSLMIPPAVANRLFLKLNERPYTFQHNGKSYSSLKWVEGVPPLCYHLDKDQTDRFTLDLKELAALQFLETYHYILHQDTLYHLPEAQFDMLLEVTGNLPQHAQLYIENSQIEQIISSVVPSLNKLGKVQIADNISNQMINPPLTIKFFMNLENERLLARMEYHYGEIVIQPLQSQGSEHHDQKYILMREIDKENEFMSLIESSLFKWNGNEMYLDEEEEIFTFLFELLPKLTELADIYMTSAVRKMLGHEQNAPKTKIEINPATNLLEVQFEMNGIDQQDIQHLLQSVVERKKYYRMTDGTFVTLEHDDWQNIRELFEELEISKSALQEQSITLPVLRGLQIENILAGNPSSVKMGKALRKLLQHMKHPEDLEFAVPQTVRHTLRDYQKHGFQWLKTLAHYRFGGILADDMGLGKTLQSIAFILSEKEQNQTMTDPALIVCPSSLVYNWRNECHKFAPHLRVALITGEKEERATMMEDWTKVDVIITSYPLFRRDIDLYLDKTFYLLILDEAQAIKNDQTLTSQSVRKIKAAKRFALTGTPIENSLDELWSIFQVILPGLFPGKQRFRELPQDKISRMVSPFILRRMKKEVLKELPEKIETVQVSELTKDQKKLYLGYLEKIQQDARSSMSKGEFRQNRMKILAGLTRLRQICCHPALFIDNYADSSGKLEQLMEMINEGLSSGRRMLIFSQFTGMLAIIRQELEQHNVDYFYLDGKTDKQERVVMTEKFNQGEKNAFLISLKAGGTGLNLTGADTVILYDLWWNPAVDEQAIDRAYRMGQKNVVQVIRLITQGTIEEKIFELQQKKKELIDKVIQSGETMMSTLSEHEICELLDI